MINGYIPSDENIVAFTIYKFQKLGKTEPIYVWLAIDHHHGIGSALDNFGLKDREEALMSVLKFLDTSEDSMFKHVYTEDFEEVLEARSYIKEKLTQNLKLNLKITWSVMCIFLVRK